MQVFFRTRIPVAIIFLWFIGAGLVLFGCSENASGRPKQSDARKRAVVPVSVASAVEKTVPIQIRTIGNVRAYATVAVRSRVEGELIGVHFKEGEEVKAGQLLFTVDPRPFEAQLKAAEANLARNRAQLQAAQKQAERYGAVVKKGYVSEDQHDQIASNAAALEAAVRASEAAVETARLELKYCSIHSPVNGIAGQLKIHQGNLIKANDSENPLVTINQIRPVYVVFSVPEQNLPELRKYLARGNLDVVAVVPGKEDTPVYGKLSFIDNSIDQATGTILLRATFANSDQFLWPGQFVEVVLTLDKQTGVVVPAQAIQTGQNVRYVFVVREDSTVEYRPVILARTVGEDAVVQSGLLPGEVVVIDGQLRLAQGSQVKIVKNDQTSGEDASK